MAVERFEEEEQQQSYRKAVEDDMIPVTNDQQLGQDILRTFARISDPDMVEYKKIRKKVPIFEVKTVLDKNGVEKEVEYVDRYEMEEWEVPIRIQPSYHELITDDYSRAFLDDNDLALLRDLTSYCKAVKSFANRYELDLALHHNNFADESYILVTSSGSHKGKRVQLAKTNIAQTTYRENLFQETGGQQKKKKGILGSLGV